MGAELAIVAVSGFLGAVLTWIPLIAAAICIYFIPTFVAKRKKHIQKTAIMLVNIFLGWTFIGWVVALVWAVMKQPEPAAQKSEESVEKTEAPAQQ